MSARSNKINKATLEKKRKKDAVTEYFLSDKIVEIDESKEYTKKLLVKIPLKDLIHIVGMYKMMSMHGLAIISHKKSKRTLYQHKLFLQLLNELNEVLDKFKTAKCLKDDNKEKIINYIKIQLAFSEMGASIITEELLKKCFDTKGRPIKDPYLAFLITSLVLLSLQKTGKPQYGILSEFLYEQGIIKQHIEYHHFEKLYKRAMKSPEKLQRILTYPKIFKFMTELESASPEDQKDLPDWLINMILTIFNK